MACRRLLAESDSLAVQLLCMGCYRPETDCPCDPLEDGGEEFGADIETAGPAYGDGDDPQASLQDLRSKMASALRLLAQMQLSGPAPGAGRCSGCGCTDKEPCLEGGPCFRVDSNASLCSRCAATGVSP
jgi:hypothetical protein